MNGPAGLVPAARMLAPRGSEGAQAALGRSFGVQRAASMGFSCPLLLVRRDKRRAGAAGEALVSRQGARGWAPTSSRCLVLAGLASCSLGWRLLERERERAREGGRGEGVGPQRETPELLPTRSRGLKTPLKPASQAQLVISGAAPGTLSIFAPFQRDLSTHGAENAAAVQAAWSSSSRRPARRRSRARARAHAHLGGATCFPDRSRARTRRGADVYTDADGRVARGGFSQRTLDQKKKNHYRISSPAAPFSPPAPAS